MRCCRGRILSRIIVATEYDKRHDEFRLWRFCLICSMELVGVVETRDYLADTIRQSEIVYGANQTKFDMEEKRK